MVWLMNTSDRQKAGACLPGRFLPLLSFTVPRVCLHSHTPSRVSGSEGAPLLCVQTDWDTWVAQLVRRLPVAQVMIPESWD